MIKSKLTVQDKIDLINQMSERGLLNLDDVQDIILGPRLSQEHLNSKLIKLINPSEKSIRGSIKFKF